jgi:hypothetical protein
MYLKICYVGRKRVTLAWNGVQPTLAFGSSVTMSLDHTTQMSYKYVIEGNIEEI